MTATVTLVALLLLARRVVDLARGRAEVRPRTVAHREGVA